jgi:flagellar basal body P-ring protein FlgI
MAMLVRIVLHSCSLGWPPARARPCRAGARPGQFQGVRSNQLTGYGMVVGLAGTGDDNLEYLTQAMRGVRPHGCNCRPASRPA